jgi:hypothetical protein
MMKAVVFSFGKATRCRIISEDGTIVREVIADARRP